MTTPPAAFLSHATADRELVHRLARDLREHGVDVWYAEWELRPGDSLRRKIDEGIDRATHFLVLLTPNSLRSEWVQTELDAGMVNRIAGKCRLIPILSGIKGEDVPATLRGTVWVEIDSYENGLRKLVDVCHGVSVKPPLGDAPAWATDRPLPQSGLSTHAQRLVAFLNKRSTHGVGLEDIVDQAEVLKELGITPEQLGMAASELEDVGFVKLLKNMGMGVAGFSSIYATATLFVMTDAALQGWDPEQDARPLAAAMVNQGEDYATLARVDQVLGWGPRRLNPAAEYLAMNGWIRPLNTHGSLPYTFSSAGVDHRTRRFAEQT